jgi:hypothetical protein
MLASGWLVDRMTQEKRYLHKIGNTTTRADANVRIMPAAGQRILEALGSRVSIHRLVRHQMKVS